MKTKISAKIETLKYSIKAAFVLSDDAEIVIEEITDNNTNLQVITRISIQTDTAGIKK